jgi:hypothetical protein
MASVCYREGRGVLGMSKQTFEGAHHQDLMSLQTTALGMWTRAEVVSRRKLDEHCHE